MPTRNFDEQPLGRGEFIEELTAAFSVQHRGGEARGALVESVELSGSEDDDFALSVRFRNLRTGSLGVNTIPRVRRYMYGCDAETAAELAGFWQQELDEMVLTQKPNANNGV